MNKCCELSEIDRFVFTINFICTLDDKNDVVMYALVKYINKA